MDYSHLYKDEAAKAGYLANTAAAEKYLSELKPRLKKIECLNPDINVFLHELKYVNSYHDGSGIDWLDLKHYVHSLGMPLWVPDVIRVIRHSKSRAILHFLMENIDKYSEFVEIVEFTELVGMADQYFIEALDFDHSSLDGSGFADKNGFAMTLRVATRSAEESFPENRWQRLSALIQLIEIQSESAFGQADIVSPIIIDKQGFCEWWNDRCKGRKETYKISGEELMGIVDRLANFPQKTRRVQFTKEIKQKTSVDDAAKNIWQNLSRKNGVASKFIDPDFDWSIK